MAQVDDPRRLAWHWCWTCRLSRRLRHSDRDHSRCRRSSTMT